MEAPYPISESCYERVKEVVGRVYFWKCLDTSQTQELAVIITTCQWENGVTWNVYHLGISFPLINMSVIVEHMQCIGPKFQVNLRNY